MPLENDTRLKELMDSSEELGQEFDPHTHAQDKIYDRFMKAFYALQEALADGSTFPTLEAEVAYGHELATKLIKHVDRMGAASYETSEPIVVDGNEWEVIVCRKSPEVIA